MIPHQSRCFEHTMQRTTARSVLRPVLRCGPFHQRRRVSLKADGYPRDFTFLPNFYSLPEQRILLSAALQRLDSLESRQYRRRRKEYLCKNPQRDSQGTSIQDVFLPDESYCFEDVRHFYGCHIMPYRTSLFYLQGHYDGVIKRFREMHVSSWPQDIPELLPLLDRLLTVHPPAETQTHLLHLSSDGEILVRNTPGTRVRALSIARKPHVDNLGASGSWILGVCLGSDRVLRLENTENSSDSYELMLPSGCVYMQKYVRIVPELTHHSSTMIYLGTR